MQPMLQTALIIMSTSRHAALLQHLLHRLLQKQPVAAEIA
jgi:hypothetical protein